MLNRVRNRLAHNLDATLTYQDTRIFLSAPYFVALRNALSAPTQPSPEPLDVLEDFALHCGVSLDAAIDPLW